MKRLITLLLVAFTAFNAAAQNNPYEIDDDCFAYFDECERNAGTDAFAPAAEKLLHAAIAKNDTKAQVLYYVTVLKHTIRLRPSNRPTTEEDDAEVLRRHNELKDIAERLGYIQYFYYSYELTQNYFYNHGKPLVTIELIQEMQETANKRNNPYGIWMSYRYLVALYISEGDYITAKEYILKAIQIYNETNDPTVKKQSLCRLYCDLADTYVIGTDSVKINVDKAIASSKVHLDTLRYTYYLAKIAVFEHDLDSYRKYRDYCLADPYLSTISKTANRLFETLDAISSGTMDFSTINNTTFSRVREVKYIANVAEKYGYKDEAFEIEKQLVRRYETLFSSHNRSRVSELDARLGNDILNAELSNKSEQLHKVSRIAFILLSIILLVIVIFMLLHLRSLKKHNRELEEANERVTLANAAKTRFVQNMSHEVRTPLNAIVGFSQLLSLPDGTFPETEKEEFAGHIVNNSKMLTMLLDDILNASAMDTGKYQIHFDDGELHFMCQAAISSTEHRLQPGVTMSYEPESPEPYHFRTDPMRVQQILINLLTNACKHTASGSIVLSSSLKADPGFVTMAVTDTGTGVPADQAEKIFERFTKLNEFVQGTGLGLSICRDIAELMGAKVYLDTSWAGPGARFVFSVPVVPPEENNKQA